MRCPGSRVPEARVPATREIRAPPVTSRCCSWTLSCGVFKPAGWRSPSLGRFDSCTASCDARSERAVLATAPQPRPARGKRLLPRLRGRSPLTRTARGPRASRLAELVLPSVLRQRPWPSRAPSRSHRPSGQHRLAPALAVPVAHRGGPPPFCDFAMFLGSYSGRSCGETELFKEAAERHPRGYPVPRARPSTFAHSTGQRNDGVAVGLRFERASALRTAPD
jgi:hypothetical protein